MLFASLLAKFECNGSPMCSSQELTTTASWGALLQEELAMKQAEFFRHLKAKPWCGHRYPVLGAAGMSKKREGRNTPREGGAPQESLKDVCGL